MSAEDNKAIVTASFEAIFNQHQVDRAAEFYAPDYLDHAAATGDGARTGGAKQKWSAYIAALPDMRATIVDLVAEGDRVAVGLDGRGHPPRDAAGYPGQREVLPAQRHGLLPPD
jgi:predicted SnoaL-like aldol condensation-catalyzing enzyme